VIASDTFRDQNGGFLLFLYIYLSNIFESDEIELKKIGKGMD